ncbi:MAG: pentapeptide repeat-containing protein [Desulfobacula sp.]|jgi:nucleoside phosphorylase
MQVHINVFRCSTRTCSELNVFLKQLPVQDCPQWILVDGLDELRGDRLGSLDKLLHPIHSHLLDGTLRLVLSVRPDAAQHLLVPPFASQVSTREWDDAWAGIETAEGLRIAILQLQELRYPDVELYASKRSLGMDFISHLRSLYDLRELVRRFFLLVKLCDLAEQLPSGEWKRIRARNQLYESLLTTWLEVESKRDPGKLPLLASDLLDLLEIAAIYIDLWAGNNKESFVVKLGDTLHENTEYTLHDADAYVIAEALVNANIVTDVGFAHKSMEEFLLARALANCMRTSQVKPLTAERITDDVIGFLSEDESFRSWLDHNQDSISAISSNYLPHFVRILHRQGRSVPGLDLKRANLGGLQLPGVRLKGADLRGASLEGTHLGPADLTDTDLRGALFHNVSVWWGLNAAEIFASVDGQDRVWIIYPTANKSLGAAVLVKIGFNEGRIAVYNNYDPHIDHLCSDGQTLYKIPNKFNKTNVEVTQWIGENIPSERWWLQADTAALSSISMPGSVWHVGVENIKLYNNYDELLLSHSHTNGSVRGAIGVSRTSDFARCQIDGFCLIGSKLRSICCDKYLQIGDGLPLHQPVHHIVAVGETRIIFKAGVGWRTWMPRANESTDFSALENVLRVIAIPGGGFALIRHKTVDFVTEDICTVISQSIGINPHCHVIGIKRERRRAILLVDRHKMFIIDEKTGQEDVNWLSLRANGAIFDKETRLSTELQSALIGAGAHDESLISAAPALGGFMTQMASSEKLKFDILLVTVNQHEFDAIYNLAKERLGAEPEYRPLNKRVYFDLGSFSGVRVGMVRSQMGSTKPGASTTTTLQAMREVLPRYIVAVGIAFGVDPEKQPIGQILYSETLQDYNLLKVGTNINTGQRIIDIRGEKVTPNPTLLNRVQSAADRWRLSGNDITIKPALILSGDKLVDNLDYRQQLLELFPEARGGEMEATGVYSASREEETPWIVIKAICDYADGKKRENKEERQKLAASNAANFVFYLINLGGFANLD